jgi:murein DD-endopeptidase MepM/ murein hydrolase activator NlpD
MRFHHLGRRVAAAVFLALVAGGCSDDSIGPTQVTDGLAGQGQSDRTASGGVSATAIDPFPRDPSEDEVPRPGSVFFSWPLRPAAGFADYGYYVISNYVDHDPSSGDEDYMGGSWTYDGHDGTDIRVWPFYWWKMDHDEVEVIAAAGGQVVEMEESKYDRNCAWDGSDWNFVTIEHYDGTRSIYGHLKQNSVVVSVGDVVARGDLLGLVGSSGNSTNPHLHFEVHDPDGNVVDPFCGEGDGSCSSMWLDQERYEATAVLKVMTNSAEPVFGCWHAHDSHVQEDLNEKTTFLRGATVRATTFFRHLPSESIYEHRLVNPSGVVVESGLAIAPYGTDGLTTEVSYSRVMKSTDPVGTWKYQIVYAGVTYETEFQLISLLPRW